MKRAALVTTLTQTYKPCDVTFGCVFVARGQRDRQKIIIIYNINKLFCQLFQRHHHSCANRFGVTLIRALKSPSGLKRLFVCVLSKFSQIQIRDKLSTKDAFSFKKHKILLKNKPSVFMPLNGIII